MFFLNISGVFLIGYQLFSYLKMTLISKIYIVYFPCKKMSLTNILKNKKHLRKLTTEIAFFLSLINYGFAQNRSINFEKENFENTKEIAKKSDKIIFIDGYAPWCIPCKEMDKKVFTNDAVADFYNKNFLNIKINMESEEGKKIKELFSVKAYPTFLYINGKGKLIHKASGGLKPEKFVNLGEEALNPKTQLAAFNEKYEKGNRDSEFIYEYLKKLERADIDCENISKDYFKTQKEEDFTSKINWNILFINECKTDIDSKAFNYLIKNKTKFDEIYTADSVDEKIFNAYSYDFITLFHKKSFNDSIYQEWKNKIKEQNFSKVEEVLLEADLLYNEKIFNACSKDFKSLLLKESFNDSVYQEWKNKIKEQNFSKVEEVLLEADLLYSERIKNWDAYISNAVLLVENSNRYNNEGRLSKKYHNEKRLNTLAWTLFEKTKNKNHLEKALNWAENSVKIADKSYNNDTYACLIYILGDTAKAIQIEKRAIKLIKIEKNEQYIDWLNKSLSKNLQKMKAGEKLN